MSDIQSTLTERGKRYGDFADHAQCTQELKFTIANHNVKGHLNLSQQEALDMICHKIGRIVCGDPNYDDSWRDIAGYAMLIVNQLNEVKDVENER